MKNSYKTMLRPAWMLLVLIAAVAGCSKAEKEANIASDADLEGKTVATMPGTIYDIEYSKQEGVTIMRLPSTSDLMPPSSKDVPMPSLRMSPTSTSRLYGKTACGKPTV